MDLSSLARHQKRILDWKDFLEINEVPTNLRERISNSLALYGKILVDCSNNGVISQEALNRMGHYERELEMLNEDVRLTTAQTISRDVEK